MSSILCLAHYCDTHGPTPLMVTEGLPVGCGSCFGDDLSTRRPSTGSRSIKPSEGLVGSVGIASRTNSSSSNQENAAQRAELQRSSNMRSQAPNAIETPPGSPRVAALQSAQTGNGRRRDSSFRKTYDENDKERAIPCENCALTLPKKTKEGSDTTAQATSGIIDNSGPILRTRKPYERVAHIMPEPSPPKSSSSSDTDDSEEAMASEPHIGRTGSSSSSSSFTSTLSHTHFLDYTSTHEPLAPTSFSIIRQSCLRTLTCETLPPSSNQYTTSAPSSPFPNSFSSGPTGSTSSGGPIFFGDALAGYTTAFIFRIPDPTARGRRRVYALMALSTHRERLAMQTFSFLSAAFRDLAAWIQGLAELELERSESAQSPRTGNEDARYTPTSSFLSAGRSRGGFDGRLSMGPKPRGLAELVGLPDFFIELHTRFVRLLIELGLMLGGA